MPSPWLAALTLAVEVSGASTCPTPAEVEARLRPLLPEAEAVSRHAVRLLREGDVLRIELSDRDGAPLANRRLKASAACAELASAVAVVVATWEVELRGRGVLGMWLASPPAEASVGPLRASRTMSIGFGAFGAVAASSTTAAGLVEAAAGTAQGRWEALFALRGVADHRVPLAAGTVRWRRVVLGAGPRLTLRTGPWRLSATAEAMLALLLMRGEGFDRDLDDAALDPGASLTLRVGVEASSVMPWLGGTLMGWPLVRSVAVEGLAADQRMPRLEVLLGAGLTLAFGP